MIFCQHMPVIICVNFKDKPQRLPYSYPTLDHYHLWPYRSRLAVYDKSVAEAKTPKKTPDTRLLQASTSPPWSLLPGLLIDHHIADPRLHSWSVLEQNGQGRSRARHIVTGCLGMERRLSWLHYIDCKKMRMNGHSFATGTRWSGLKACETERH